MTFSAWPEIHRSWFPVLEPVAEQLQRLMEHIASRRDNGEHIEPAPKNVLRVFSMPLDQVKVVIVGQDPYPTPGHAVGLSFAMHPHVRPLARSLINIYRELEDDLGIAPAESGDLSGWEAQGVLLLNRVLTVTALDAGSHRNLGWEDITDAVIDGLASRGMPLVVMLWGGQAKTLAPRFRHDDTLVITSAHPSPLSARRGFFGSKPFSKANDFLMAHGVEPIDWSARSLEQPAQAELF